MSYNFFNLLQNRYTHCVMNMKLIISFDHYIFQNFQDSWKFHNMGDAIMWCIFTSYQVFMKAFSVLVSWPMSHFFKFLMDVQKGFLAAWIAKAALGMLLVSQWSKSSENYVLDLRIQRIPLVFLSLEFQEITYSWFWGSFLGFLLGLLMIP